MAKHSRYHNKRQVPKRRAPLAAGAAKPEPEVRDMTPRPPKVYGKPFVLLEDANKNTFKFSGGAWVPHSQNIAECRQDCDVKELPQKVNKMTRYEIRCQIVD